LEYLLSLLLKKLRLVFKGSIFLSQFVEVCQLATKISSQVFVFKEFIVYFLLEVLKLLSQLSNLQDLLCDRLDLLLVCVLERLKLAKSFASSAVVGLNLHTFLIAFQDVLLGQLLQLRLESVDVFFLPLLDLGNDHFLGV
jgi:hypothetical protein